MSDGLAATERRELKCKAAAALPPPPLTRPELNRGPVGEPIRRAALRLATVERIVAPSGPPQLLQFPQQPLGARPLSPGLVGGRRLNPPHKRAPRAWMDQGLGGKRSGEDEGGSAKMAWVNNKNPKLWGSRERDQKIKADGRQPTRRYDRTGAQAIGTGACCGGEIVVCWGCGRGVPVSSGLARWRAALVQPSSLWSPSAMGNVWFGCSPPWCSNPQKGGRGTSAPTACRGFCTTSVFRTCCW